MMEELEAAPARIASLLSSHSLPQACEAVVQAVRMSGHEDMGRFDVMVPTKRRIIELWEMCYMEAVRELKRLVFGCYIGKDGKWRAVDDWLKSGGAQQQLMMTIEGLQTLGRDAIARADTELAASLRPSLHGLITLLVEKEERRQTVDQRSVPQSSTSQSSFPESLFFCLLPSSLAAFPPAFIWPAPHSLTASCYAGRGAHKNWSNPFSRTSEEFCVSKLFCATHCRVPAASN